MQLFSAPRSQEEKEVLVQTLRNQIRIDGRSCLEFRTCTLQKDILPTALGSARLRKGGLEVVASINAAAIPLTEKIFVASVTINCQEHLQNKKLRFFELQLEFLLEEIFTNCLKTRELLIGEGSFRWALKLDVLVLGHSDGLIDSITLASHTALKTALIPVVELTEEGELNQVEGKTLSLSSETIPLTISLGRLGTEYAVDLLDEEESCVDCLLVCSFGSELELIRKYGTGTIKLTKKSINELFILSKQRKNIKVE